MGWDFTSGATKADRIRELTKGWESDDATHTVIRKCVKGNILWYVMEIRDKATDATSRWIGCSLLGAEKGFGWGSKDMSEEMGPCFYNVPLEYLDMVPEPAHNYGWRAKVRAYWAAAGRKLTVGETVKLRDGCRPAEITIETLKPLRGRGPDGRMYKIPRRLLAPTGDDLAADRVATA